MLDRLSAGWRGYALIALITLAAVLTMRERTLDWAGNRAGLSGQKRLRIYCSDQVHTSIDRIASAGPTGCNSEAARAA